jgi:hypothetical protein
MPLFVRYARLAGGNECIDLETCRQHLCCVVVGDPPTPRPDTLKYFYVMPDGKRWLQAFGNHLSRSGYATSDGRFVPTDVIPDARWTYIETHPVVVAHYFIIDGMMLPVELEPYRHLADGPAYSEWLSRQGPGLPGSQEARDAEARRCLVGSQSDSPAGSANPSTVRSTTPGPVQGSPADPIQVAGLDLFVELLASPFVPFRRNDDTDDIIDLRTADVAFLGTSYQGLMFDALIRQGDMLVIARWYRDEGRLLFSIPPFATPREVTKSEAIRACMSRGITPPIELYPSQSDPPAGTTDPSSAPLTPPETPPGPATEGGAKGTTGASRTTARPASTAASKRVPESRQRAYGQYLAAVRELGDNATDRDAFEWLKERQEISARLTFDTWGRYVREARSADGKNKNTSRAGRECRSGVDLSGKDSRSGQEAD